MREVAEDHLVAAFGLREHAAEVSEHPARDVHAAFLADDLGGALLESVDGRVLAVLVVADLGVGHRLAHRRRRQGEGVAAELDDPHNPNVSFTLMTVATSRGATKIAGR